MDTKQKYLTARRNLLLMLIFTAVNILLFVAGSDTMMLFSATVPYFGIVFGSILGNSSFMIFCICISVAIMVVYLLCWILSKEHYGWMIVALVLFSIDTLMMIGIYVMLGDFSGFLDVIIHVWVLYYLIVGVSSGHKLKNMPDELPCNAESENVMQENAAQENTVQDI